jgi:hypothetical protein
MLLYCPSKIRMALLACGYKDDHCYQSTDSTSRIVTQKSLCLGL